MEIVLKPLSELHVPEKNVRRHPEKQIKEYIRSLDQFGQTKPILIDEEGEIIAGIGLYLSMQQRGDTEAWCRIMPDMTPAKKKKLMLADNRLYELGITDTDVFEDIIKELQGDVDVPGYDEDLLEMINATVAETNDLIESYGIYGEDEVEKVNQTVREEHSSPPENTASPDFEEAHPPAETERYVICPKCGEKICL
ncbi:MAG: ParB N-terminal domain-containing protein [Clostridia bacterium]|nr:ParB N-terminal domain-containing protein [Clostridia bacterium]